MGMAGRMAPRHLAGGFGRAACVSFPQAIFDTIFNPAFNTGFASKSGHRICHRFLHIGHIWLGEDGGRVACSIGDNSPNEYRDK